MMQQFSKSPSSFWFPLLKRLLVPRRCRSRGRRLLQPLKNIQNILLTRKSSPLLQWTLRLVSLNDDLSLTLTVHQVAETRSKIDCPINDTAAILQIMFFARHIITVNSTIIRRSSLCYLMNGLNLMKGRRLGP